MLKYVFAHIQYDNETFEQAEARWAAMQAHNDEMDRIAASMDAPMKGIRPGWDCGCPLLREHHGCPNTACPRIGSEAA